jgi:uncharacterized protein YjbI with pentapeptide repeats
MDGHEETAAVDAAPTEEPEAAPIDWPQCEVDGCIGVHAPEKTRCLAHLEFGELHQLLEAGLTSIDLRGVPVNSVLLHRVTLALPVDGDMRIAEDCRFDHATFTENVHFLRVHFGGSCTFRNVSANGLFTFGFCRFDPKFAVMFNECTLSDGITISDSTVLGPIFLASSSADSMMIKKSRFEGDLIILKIAGRYLFIDECKGRRISVQDCQLRLGSLKNSEFQSIEAGALSVEESFLLTRATGTQVRLGTITAKDQILIDQCEFGGAESIGPLKADGAVSLKRSTLTTRRTIAVEGGALDLTDSRFPEGVTISTSGRKLVLDETHYGRSSLITGSSDGQQPHLRSALRADLQNLALDNVDLSDCEFTNVHNLDALRLRRATFAASPAGIGLRPFRAISRRRVLLEERLWRSRRRSRGWATLEGADAAPDAAEIAELYRSLRSGLEQARNEPGAADFYYGETEMRRHDRHSSLAEKAILAGYWAFSGYGLRASRSLTALVALVLLFALAFWSVGFHGGHPSSFWSALTYSAGAATLRPPPRQLTTSGEALSIALRIIGPVLLGLAALSIRGRVRR